jgi:hypothetical protein
MRFRNWVRDRPIEQGKGGTAEMPISDVPIRESISLPAGRFLVSVEIAL